MPNTTVRAWRDDVSEKLGYITAKMEEMHGDIKITNGKVCNHEERINILETSESNKQAVKKWMSGVWAACGAGVMYILSRIWDTIK